MNNPILAPQTATPSLGSQPLRPEKIHTTTAGLCIEVPAVGPQTLNREVFALFEAEASLIGLPVVEDGAPIGMINRNIFMQSMARPFHREIYLAKSCIAFMDKTPLIVEGSTSIQELSFLVLDSGEKALADGFIITDNGQYRGIGIAQDMLRAVATLQAEKNRLVMESIEYASVIQKSLSRSSREAMRNVLSDYFLIWEPRDVVSGDFYFFEQYDDGFLLMLFDCTGHGVPGAFMTLIMSAFLQGALNSQSRRDPGQLLTALNRRVKLAMSQVDHQHTLNDGEHSSDDGMDAAVCWFDQQNRRLTYAGAHLPMFVLRPDDTQFTLCDGNRAGVGYATTPMEQSWDNHTLDDLPAGSSIYFFTDGMPDQLGGAKRIAFGKKRIQEVLLKQRSATLPEQRAALLEALAQYQGQEARKDDVSAFGFRI